MLDVLKTPHKTKSSAFLFQTHLVNTYIRERLEQLVSQASDLCDVYLLIPKPNKIDTEHLARFLSGLDVGVVTYDTYDVFENAFGFRQEEFRRAFYKTEYIPFILFLEQFSGYNYLWRCEYDVFYSGDWASFISHFSEEEYDFVSTNIYEFYGKKPHWKHWWKARSFDDFKSQPIKPKSMLRSHNGIFGMSSGFAETLRKNVTNFRGHYEIVLPTMAKRFNHSIRDIGGFGEYVLDCDKGKYYVTTQDVPGLRQSLSGTYGSHGNYFIMDSYEIDMLYHPVKVNTNEYSY